MKTKRGVAIHKDDFFRPPIEPARTIYDAIRSAQAMGIDRITAAKCAAWDYVKIHGGRTPTEEEIQSAERGARGHTDYTAQFARTVAFEMIPETK